MFLSILLGSVVVGLAFAASIIYTPYWWAVPVLCLCLGVPTAYITAKWPYWTSERQARKRTIEFDFTGLKPGQIEYYEACLRAYVRGNPKGHDRKYLLDLSRSMERVKARNINPGPAYIDSR